MAENAICIENMTKEFGPVRALDSLSLEVPFGIVFGFLGPNGAGKTTTIRLLLGLLEPTSGEARVCGFDTRTQAERVRANTGALLEYAGIYEQLSALDNLEFYGRAFRMPAADRRARIQELLSQMGLWNRRQDRAGSWSRGMKQKLALARALLHRPRLILLDEPTAGLDVQAAVVIREELAELAAREQVTIFLTTHNMSEAEKLCHQVAVIRDGKLVAQASPSELAARASGHRLEVLGQGFGSPVLAQLHSHPAVAQAEATNGRLTLSLTRETDISTLINLMVGAGARVHEVRRSQASLEETFLALMEGSQENEIVE